MDTICHLHPQTPCSSSLPYGSICFARLIQGVLQLDFFLSMFIYLAALGLNCGTQDL